MLKTRFSDSKVLLTHSVANMMNHTGILHMTKTEFQGSPKERGVAMKRTLKLLTALAQDFSAPVLLTNQVIANIGQRWDWYAVTLLCVNLMQVMLQEVERWRRRVQ